MTKLKGAQYTIEDRRLIAKTPDLRVQILALASTNCRREIAVAFRRTPHQVAGRNGGRCRFVIVQGVGPDDYTPVED